MTIKDGDMGGGERGGHYEVGGVKIDYEFIVLIK